MIMDSIDTTVLQQVVRELPESFTTRDVSEHRTVLAAHAALSAHRHYHAFIGKKLKTLPDLDHVGTGPRGALWRKRSGTLEVAPAQRAEKADRPQVASPDGALGPQSSGDNKLARRLRRHQSWYRHAVLGLPYGTGPQAKDKTSYGNMLRPEDGAAGRNFLTPEIFAAAQRREAQGVGTVEPYRLYHNMLSSQPMCFNLFGALVENLPLATRLAKALWGDRIAEVTAVRLEYAPSPAHEYLDDRTAFDALIEYVTEAGEPGFVGIETKLSEPFSQQHCDGEAYRRWMTPDSPWRADAHDQVDATVHNQLWRDHLLAWSMLQRGGSRWREGRLMVLHHPIDQHCAKVVNGYRRLLRDDTTCESWTLDEVIERWRAAAPEVDWINEFAVRYLELERSA